MANETDLLKDPLLMAQQMYQQQNNAFKDEHIPKPTRKDFTNWASSRGYRPAVLNSRRNNGG